MELQLHTQLYQAYITEKKTDAQIIILLPGVEWGIWQKDKVKPQGQGKSFLIKRHLKGE